VDEEVFSKRFLIPLTMVQGEVYGATGPAGNEIRAAEQRYLAGESDEALPLFQKALKNAKDERVIAYLHDRVFTTSTEIALDADGWVDIMPGEGLVGWRPVRGSWTLQPDGSLAGLAVDRRSTMIVCNARIEGNFEMRGEIELPPDRGGGGVIPHIKRPGRWNWTTFRIDVASGRAMMGRSFYSPTEERQVKLKPINIFVVQAWDERVTVYLNGELLFTDYDFEKVAPGYPKAQVGLGGRHGEQFEVPTLYRNVQIRRLTTKPVPKAPG